MIKNLKIFIILIVLFGLFTFLYSYKFQIISKTFSTLGFNEKEAKEELIDIWHFVIQASIELNLTPDEILDEYKRKNEINRQRQKDGY